MIKGIDHIALSVSDLERSISFYTEIFGLEVIRVIECPPEKGLGKIAGVPGCSARIAHIKSGETMLELFEYRRPRGKSLPSDRSQADIGFIHIGFTSTDARADYKRLKSLGIETFSEPVEFRPGVWLFYFYGPDGEVCEVREV